MIVVADASPIICLARIGRLRLLENLFGTVLVPPAVHAEIAAGHHGEDVLRESPWIEVRHVTDLARATALAIDLDAGEAAAIALALECRADALLIDEQHGRRRVASRHGLMVLGVVGVILRARRSGLIVAVKPVLDDLVTKAGFWLSRDVITTALRLAGEVE